MAIFYLQIQRSLGEWTSKFNLEVITPKDHSSLLTILVFLLTLYFIRSEKWLSLVLQFSRSNV